jgi:hypothetical protein
MAMVHAVVASDHLTWLRASYESALQALQSWVGAYRLQDAFTNSTFLFNNGHWRSPYVLSLT